MYLPASLPFLLSASRSPSKWEGEERRRGKEVRRRGRRSGKGKKFEGQEG
jgi:hypothetical protein